MPVYLLQYMYMLYCSLSLSSLQSADENLNFEEQILEAAKNIAGATSALVKSATAAQRELVAQGKLSSNPQSEDGQWSEGLVSAVRYTHTFMSRDPLLARV